MPRDEHLIRSFEGKRATIRDVARLAGVDISLVSRVVNDHPKASASPETRQRIAAAVETLGYQASAVARGLRMSRTFTLGLLLPDISNPLYVDIVRGVQERARERGYGVAIGTQPEGEEETTMARLLELGRVDGLLVASGMLRDTSIRRLSIAGGGPIVVVNRRVRGVDSSVVVNDSAGAAMATNHLVEAGHTRIAGLFGPPHIDTAKRRRAGFLEACKGAHIEGIAIDCSSWDARVGYSATRALLSAGSPPTALFASTFMMGMGSLRAARDEHVLVPKELSVVALHDSEIADYLYPALTTVAMPAQRMGELAVDQLVSLLDGGAHRHLVVDEAPVLVQRASVDQ